MSDVHAKREARLRLHELVIEDKQRKSLINAYKLKKHILEDDSIPKEEDKGYCIRTMDPIPIIPEGKYTHSQGALISPPPRSADKSITDMHSPTMRRTMIQHSPLVQKLTSKDAYPATYQKRIESSMNEDHAGDIIDMSKRTSKLLKDASASSLYVPARASDFRSEIRWRLMLRNSS